MRAIFDLNKKMDYSTREAMNSFKTNLSFCGQDKKIIVITSCGENEGKSQTCINLAKTVAEDGKKVLLIDADMRKSVMAGRIELEKDGGKAIGLSHYLSGQAKMEDVICQTNIDGMYMIFAGHVPPNPSGLLNTEEFQTLIGWARDEYDLVIVDCPPLGMVIDAAIASKYADGSIILVEVCEVSYHAVEEVKKQLELSGCEVLGVVLNKMPKQGTSYYKRYYRGYYKGYYKGYYSKYKKYEQNYEK